MIVEATAVIGAAKSALDLVKSLGSLVKDSSKTELREKTTELAHKIADLTQQVTELALLNSELHGQLLQIKQAHAKLEEQLTIKGQMVSDRTYYTRKLPDGSTDGPFCMRCFDVDGRLVRIKNGMMYQGRQHTFCPQCDLMERTGKASSK